MGLNQVSEWREKPQRMHAMNCYSAFICASTQINHEDIIHNKIFHELPQCKIWKNKSHSDRIE